MTVEELIENLKEMPEDSVAIRMDFTGSPQWVEVNSIYIHYEPRRFSAKDGCTRKSDKTVELI